METKIIAIANQKGGVGKTTTVLAMSAVLQEKGFKTLIVDADPQCNTSNTYGAKYDGVPTLYDVILEEERIPAANAIQITDMGEIISSDPLLIEAEKILSENKNSLMYIKEGLDQIKSENRYDFILLDTNPYLGSTLYSVLIAADEVIIPIKAEIYSLQGVNMFQETLNSVRNNYNPNLKTMGFLLTEFNPRVILSREIRDDLDKITKHFETVLFNTTIRASQKVKDAQAAYQSLTDYAPKSTSAIDYTSFVEEYLTMGGQSDGK